MTDEIIEYDFGLRIRQLREERGLSRATLAKKLGVSAGTIYRYENNLQTPSLERAKQLALILRTSLDHLTGLDSTYTVRFSGLSADQRDALDKFVRAFGK